MRYSLVSNLSDGECLPSIVQLVPGIASLFLQLFSFVKFV